MKLLYEFDRTNALAVINGEIDHHNAAEAREMIDACICADMPRVLYLDLSDITFCDSSGLGLVMGRKTKLESYGGTLILKNPSEAVNKILNIAGMDKLLKIERSKRNGT